MTDETNFESGGEDWGYRPMPDGLPKEEEKTYSTVRDATDDLVQERQTKPQPAIERGYNAPYNQTVTPERAAADLAAERTAEREAAEIDERTKLASLVDDARQKMRETLGDEPAEPEQAQQQAQPQEAGPDGLDPAVKAALEHPQVKAALQSQFSQIEQARQGFEKATRDAALVAMASIHSQFPELNGLSQEQIPVALQLMSAQNPQRYAQITGEMNRVGALVQQHQRQVAESSRQAQERFSQWAQGEDEAFTAELDKAGVKGDQRGQIRDAVVDMFHSAGLGLQEIASLWNSNPLMRSREGQMILADAARYRMAQQKARSAVAVPRPPVQRPGTSSSAQPASKSSIAALEAKLSKTTSVNDQIRLSAEILRLERAES